MMSRSPDRHRTGEAAMMSTVIGGAMLPHAPQFFTMPETEDKALVAHVREVAAEIGARLKALKPDLWIIFSNDHAEQFFHNVAPPFTVHVGGCGRIPPPAGPTQRADQARCTGHREDGCPPSVSVPGPAADRARSCTALKVWCDDV